MKLIKTILVFGYCLFSTQQLVGAQGGGPVNGPNLSGQVIPVTIDGEYPVTRVNEVMSSCMSQFLSQFTQTLYGRKVQMKPVIHGGIPSQSFDLAGSKKAGQLQYLKEEAYSRVVMESIEYADSLTSKTELIVRPGDLVPSFPGCKALTYIVSAEFSRFEEGLSFVWASGCKKHASMLKIYPHQKLSFNAHSFPSLWVKRSIRSNVDIYGNILSQDIFITGIKATVPRGTVISSIPVSIGNSVMTINAKRFLNCVRSNL